MPVQSTCERCGLPCQRTTRRFCSRRCAALNAARQDAFETRFWATVEKTNGCWPRGGYHDRDGYGQIKPSGSRSPIGAHVASWIIHFGAVPDGMFVCHHCDNPPCVRPDHLFLGTAEDNTKDRLTKGRGPLGDRSGRRLYPERWAERQARGDSHGRRVLTESQALQIIALRKAGWLTKALATEFGVSRPTVSMLLRGKTWSHLPR